MKILILLNSLLVYSFPYDRNGAVNYAYRYAREPNHRCGSFNACTPCSFWGNEICGYSSHGGDGPNFVSQCLVKGGGHPPLNGGFPCRGYPCGFEEVGGLNLANCLIQKGWISKCGYLAPPPPNIEAGDVLNYYSDGCGSGAPFSAFITVGGNNPKITSHSSVRVDVSYLYLDNTKPYYQWLHFDNDHISLKFNKENIDNGNNIVISNGNSVIIYTNTNNQKRKENDRNETNIDLSKCEDKLKKVYNITENNSIYIKRYDYTLEGIKPPIIEYELYFPFYDQIFEKLNLDECKELKAEIFYPIKLNDIIDKYNASSGYYNNLCYKATSKFGTDISLKDRQNEFVNNNMTLCEEDCDLIEYDYILEKARCSCSIKINVTSFDEIKFDKNKLFKNFVDVKNIGNIDVIKCYREVFRRKNLIKNYGFFIFIFLFLMYFITLILFYTKFYFLLKNEIKKILKAKAKNYKLEHSKKRKKSKEMDKQNKNLKLKIKRNNKNLFSSKKIKTKDKINHNEFLDNNNSENNLKITKKKTYLTTKISKIDKEYKDITKMNDNEINSLEYLQAIEMDNRNYFQYYFSLLKLNHLLIFSFNCKMKDYNSQILKIFLFFLLFSLHFTINALFFSDETMHIIYVDKGHFNFLYQIPQIIYSSLISSGVSAIIKYLSLSEDSILEFKNREEIKNLNVLKRKLIKILKIKFLLFFVLSFILLLLFGFYVSCFCGVYVNTQIHLIKDTLMSFGLSFVDPFVIYLLPGMFRIPALSMKNNECLYKFSQLVQNIL